MANEKQLVIEVRDKIATLKSKNFNLVGGNNDYDVVFDFDGDWENLPTKTAVFVFGKEKPIYQVFDGNICEGVSINNSSMCLIGVFAGDIKTTTPAMVECVYRSIIDEANGTPEPPKEDVYNQIIELLNKSIQAQTELPTGGEPGQFLKKKSNVDYDTEWANSNSVPLMSTIDEESQKEEGKEFAYDFAGKYNRVYVEKSGGGWNGKGGGVYNKFVLSSNGSPIYDPDSKDYTVDENGKPNGEKLQSVPLRWEDGHILGPSSASDYENRTGEARRAQYATVGFYEDKTAELEAEITEKIDNCANAVEETKSGDLLILDDFKPNLANAVVKGEPSTKIYVTGENLAPSATFHVSGTTDWTSGAYTIHPPKNRRYTLSCDFERKSGTIVGIAVKPNNNSISGDVEPSSTAESGTLTTTVDIGGADNVAIRFYSNFSSTARESECIFSNIVFRLADMDVAAGTEGSAEKAYTLDDNGEAVIDVPDYSPLLIYNVDGLELSATYSRDTNNSLKELNDTKVDNLSKIDKADWIEDADGIPDDWIDREVSFKIDLEAAKSAGYAYILEGFDVTGTTFTKSKGNGFAYDTDNVSSYRVYVDRSKGRGVYNKIFLTATGTPVFDPDGKDWVWSAYVKDENGNDTKKPANGAIPLYPKNCMDSMVMRHDNGDIAVPHIPTWGDSATSKYYVDDEIAELGKTKLDYNFIPSGEYNRVAVRMSKKDSDGDGVAEDRGYSYYPLSKTIIDYNHVIERSKDGIIYCAETPTYSNECASKGYVDAKGDELLKLASVDLTDYVKSEALAKVATSGAYSDLTGTPTIPSVTSVISSDNTSAVTSGAVYTALADKLSFGSPQNMSGKNFTTGFWYVWLEKTSIHTSSGNDVEDLGIVNVLIGSSYTHVMYSSRLDRDILIYGSDGSWSVTLRNSTTVDSGGGLQLYAAKLN